MVPSSYISETIFVIIYKKAFLCTYSINILIVWFQTALDTLKSYESLSEIDFFQGGKLFKTTHCLFI